MKNIDELAKILPDDLDPIQVSDFLKIHSSPGGALGETFVVRYAARWLALFRGSMLDSFTFVTLDSEEPCDLQRGSFGAKLRLHTKEGERHNLEVSALDIDRVEAFFGLEEELDSVKEAEERLSAPPGTLKAGAAPDEPPIGIGAAAAETTPGRLPSPQPADERDVEQERADDDGEELGEEELEERLIELLLSDRRPEAIALYRRAAGATRKEAREYLAELEEELREQDEAADEEDEDEEPDDDSSASPAADDAPQLPPLLEGELIGYLKLGQAAVAIRRLREAQKLGLAEATEAVAAIARRRDLSLRSSSSGWWQLFFILMAAAAVIYYLRFLRVPG